MHGLPAGEHTGNELQQMGESDRVPEHRRHVRQRELPGARNGRARRVRIRSIPRWSQDLHAPSPGLQGPRPVTDAAEDWREGRGRRDLARRYIDSNEREISL